MPQMGRGMLFPPAFLRDQYTPQEELMQELEARYEEERLCALEEAMVEEMEFEEFLLSLPEAHPPMTTEAR